ncbi:hypothetical protein LguiA_009123 [Lonicera macranthoides]
MEVVEEIVIVGAGIAGLTTSLGLHRLGIRSLVLETSDKLRITGFAFLAWTNAWKALDALGIGVSLRQQHEQLHGGEHEVRCMKRKLLLETLEKELPSGTIRYSSKLDSVEDLGNFKLLHLADGTSIKAKVLVGCDGVNSVVAKWLGFKKPAFASRSAVRGFADFKQSHGFQPKFLEYSGNNVKYGVLPCDDHTVYWFFTYTPTPQDKEIEEDPIQMKQFVLSKLGELPGRGKAVVEITELDSMVCSPLRFRHPWDLLWGNSSNGNVCVAGDALHPMTPDLGQGGCSALEDGIILARCLGKALKRKPSSQTEENEQMRIKMGLEDFAKQRKWRGFELISTAYMVGFIQQSDGKVMNFIRDKVLAGFLAGVLLKKAEFDCGELTIS